MTFEDWIFALHLLSAATLVGSLVMSWIVVVSLLSVHTPGETIALSRVAMVGTVTTVVGLIGAIAFGRSGSRSCATPSRCGTAG